MHVVSIQYESQPKDLAILAYRRCRQLLNPDSGLPPWPLYPDLTLTKRSLRARSFYTPLTESSGVTLAQRRKSADSGIILGYWVLRTVDQYLLAPNMRYSKRSVRRVAILPGPAAMAFGLCN